MTYLCDLHLHSTASDGQYHPAELVQLANNKGLQVIALTDHDSIGGIEEAQAEGAKLGIKVIPGIEMSAIEYRTFHILGYGFDIYDKTINAWFNDLEAGRQERKRRIHAFLHEKGVDFPIEEVDEMAAGGVVGRPHFCRVMLKRGICEKWEDVFNLYLDTDEFHQKVDFEKPKARECIEMIKNAGGMISLAHPYQIGIDDEELESLIRRMKDWGLDAIECYHSGHDQEKISKYLALAKRCDLHVTGGSDFHGTNKPDIELGRGMGNLYVPVILLENLKGQA